MTQDKQLRGITLESVLEKRRLDQALNAKEFAVLANISYSTALEWFRARGFPVFRGFVFWQDFTEWRKRQANAGASDGDAGQAQTAPGLAKERRLRIEDLPPRAARILLEDR